MDLLNSEYNLIEAKRAYLRFTYKKKCLKCDMPIADKVKYVLYSFLLFTRMRMFSISPAPKIIRIRFALKLIKTFKRLLNTDLYVKNSYLLILYYGKD